jgi:hypothetical protein
MSIPAGPQQVADVYRGNPTALQANMQKEQQQKPNITPDFAKLLALGTVTSEENNAAKAMALQQLQQLQAQSQTGKPPTIFEQLQRKAAQRSAAMQTQAQPQAMGLPGLAQEQEQQPMQTAAHGGLMRGIDHLPTDFQFAGGGIVAFKKGGKSTSGSENEDEQLSSFPESVDDTSAVGIDQLARSQPMSPNQQMLMGHVSKTLGLSEQDVNEEAMRRHEKSMGLADLLKQKEAGIGQREAMLKQQQEGRRPAWIDYMIGASQADPRKGLGYALAAGANASERAKGQQEEEDRKFNLELMKLKDEVLQARIEGNYKKAAVGEAAINQLRQAKATAAQTGASLENAYQTNIARVQGAKDSAAARTQAADIAAQQRAQTSAAQLAEQKRWHDTQEGQRAEQAAARQREHESKMSFAEQKRLDDLAKFASQEESRFQKLLQDDTQYKSLSLQKTQAQIGMMSKDAEKRAAAERRLGEINEAIIELAQKKRGTVAAPAVATAPPPGAVRLKQ